MVGDHGLRGRVGELLARALHPDHGDPVLAPHPGLGERDAADGLRRIHLDDREVVVEFDEVEHPARHEVRDPLARLRLGVDDVVRADPRQDLAVRLADRLRPDLRDLEVHQVRRDQHARLDGGADRDDGDREVLRADLPQRIDVAGVGLHRVRDALGPLLHEAHVLVYGEHLAVEPLQLPCRGGTEAPKSDDQHRCVVRNLVNQRARSPFFDAPCARSQPTIGLSSARRYNWALWLAASAAARVTVPMRPRNMVAARHVLGGIGGSRREPGREPAGGERADDVEQHVVQRFVRDHEQHDRRRRHQRRAPQDDADTQPQHVRRDAAIERLHLRLATGLGERREEQYGEGRHFYAAGGGCRPAADEHQHVGYELARTRRALPCRGSRIPRISPSRR